MTDEIKPTSPLDVSQRGITTANLVNFKGVPRQLLIEVAPDGTLIPVLMDGVTFGGKDKLVLKSEFDKLEGIVASNQNAGLTFALVDYSLPENQANMVIGVRYLTYLTKDKEYIQLDPDTHAQVDPSQVHYWDRIYVKSDEGEVTYTDTAKASRITDIKDMVNILVGSVTTFETNTLTIEIEGFDPKSVEKKGNILTILLSKSVQINDNVTQIKLMNKGAKSADYAFSVSCLGKSFITPNRFTSEADPGIFNFFIDTTSTTTAVFLNPFVTEVTDYVTNTTEETVLGLKTFSQVPRTTATPIGDTDLVTKKFVDDAIDTLSQPGSTTQPGLIQLTSTIDDDETKAITPKAVNTVKTVVDTNTTSIGNLNNLNTEAKDNLVNAINELKTTTVSDATTTQKGVVQLTSTINDAEDKAITPKAVNSVKTISDANKTAIGTLTELATTVKTNLVNAINEVKTNVTDPNVAKKNETNTFAEDQAFSKAITVTGTTTLKGTTNIQGTTTLTGATKIVDDTFTYDGSNILFTNKDDVNIISKTTKVKKGTNPTTNQRFYHYLTDTDSSFNSANILSSLQLGYETSGDSYAALVAFNTNASQTSNGAIKITYDKLANKFITYAPTPVDSSNTTEIATTAWVRKNFITPQNNIVKKVGTRTESGDWTLSGLIVGKPLYILINLFGSLTDLHGAQILSKNGSDGGCIDATATRLIGFYLGRTSETSRGNVFVTIPTSTTVTLSTYIVGNSELVAYQ